MKLKISILGLLLVNALNIGAMEKTYNVLVNHAQKFSKDFINPHTVGINQLAMIPGYEQIQILKNPILDLAQNYVIHLQKNNEENTDDKNNNINKKFDKLHENVNTETDNLSKKLNTQIKKIQGDDEDKKSGFSGTFLGLSVLIALVLGSGGTYYLCKKK